MKEVFIYTDGSCDFSTGRGAWAFVVMTRAHEIIYEKTGTCSHTTNNRMELTAILRALSFCHRELTGNKVTIYSDSQYCIKAITLWALKWKKFDWKRTVNAQSHVKNMDLIKECHDLYLKTGTGIEWVRGHGVSKGNNYADKLCNALVEGSDRIWEKKKKQERINRYISQ